MEYDTEKLFLEYVNNFLTVAQFAEHYGLTESQAKIIIDSGRQINHKKAGITPIEDRIRGLL